jgi:carbonic anhydrase
LTLRFCVSLIASREKIMKKLFILIVGLACIASFITVPVFAAKQKPAPEQCLKMLKEGNQRFVSGQIQYTHLGKDRLNLAGSENQGDHAYATVITCSDSRVPVEHIFDAGIMDIFVIRVAGNVCDTDEVGSIEYGLAHVNTPVLVVLGHTQCGAVTAVTQAMQGHGHELERNIPPLVDNIEPAVKRAMENNPKLEGSAVIPAAIEENVWQGIEDLFMASPSTRSLVRSGTVKVVGAIYDVGTGEVTWLPDERPLEILARVEQSPNKAMPASHASHNAEHQKAGAH